MKILSNIRRKVKTGDRIYTGFGIIILHKLKKERDFYGEKVWEAYSEGRIPTGNMTYTESYLNERIINRTYKILPKRDED